MLLNSPFYLCNSFKGKIAPVSPLYSMGSVPKSFHPTSSKSFLFCDIQGNKTLIKQFQLQPIPSHNLNIQNIQLQHNQNQYINFNDPSYIDTNKILTIDQIDGCFSSYGFTDQAVLLINRAGDFYYYNLLNKNVFMAEKQHPGLYSDAQIISLEGYFITSGGCVKNQLNSNSQRIIKVWRINEQEDTLQLKTRINTGHSKAVQSSLLINQEKIMTMSCDKTLRINNLSTQSVQRVISVNQDLFSGCSIDYNSVILGGIGKQLKMYDIRTGKTILRPITIKRDLIQITKIIRLNQNNLLLSNINQLLSLDIRTMKLTEQSKYQGQRISQITVINNQNLVIGNKQKNIQIWKAY